MADLTTKLNIIEQVKLGFVFTTPPHSSIKAREGLEAVLAASSYTENIEVFFLGSGILQLLAEQQTDEILTKNYAPMLKLLSLYDVETIYVDQANLDRYQLTADCLTIEVIVLSADEIKQKLAQCQKTVTF